MRQHLVKAKSRRVTGVWKACNNATWKSDRNTKHGWHGRNWMTGVYCILCSKNAANISMLRRTAREHHKALLICFFSNLIRSCRHEICVRIGVCTTRCVSRPRGHQRHWDLAVVPAAGQRLPLTPCTAAQCPFRPLPHRHCCHDGLAIVTWRVTRHTSCDALQSFPLHLHLWTPRKFVSPFNIREDESRVKLCDNLKSNS